MDNFNKTTLRELREKIEIALETVTYNTGVTFELGGMRYDAENCSLKMQCIIPGGKSKEQQNLELALAARHITKTKTDHPEHGTVELIGYKPRSPKFPWIGKVANGKEYKFTDAILFYFKGE